MNGLWQSIAIIAAAAALLIGLGSNQTGANDKITYPSTDETPQDFEDGRFAAGGEAIDGYDS